ncbi:Hypothetical predicted protein [Lynx pardinus]|uniref:Uncharacterized protein n=1 Tax=Lynx pardinus TaxID=191816 RepID=A0A485PC80_LYNPA|nr:Hypothetical predicted protein [Lynx pardinus]
MTAVHYTVDDCGCLTFISKLDIPNRTPSICHGKVPQHGQEDHDSGLKNSLQNSTTQVCIYEVDKHDCHKFCITGIMEP